MPKQGNLKDFEKQYIQTNCINSSDREIAESLERDIRTISRYRKSIGVIKGRGGEIEGIKSDDTEGVKVNYKNKFRKSVYYRELRQQITPNELDYYLESWGELSEQFSDIVETEKRQIDELIKAEIMGNRILKSIKIAEDELEELAKEVEAFRGTHNVENDEDSQQKDDHMISLIQRMASQSQAMSNDYQRNVELRRKILEDLTARRKDRIDSIHKAGTTFLSLVEAFREKKVREVQGRQMELIKMARDKKMKEWRDPCLFPDGSKGPFLLDDKTPTKTEEIIKEYIAPDLFNNPTEEDLSLQKE